jgi:ribosomal protein S18 acetylase RimI-like enzyme
MTGKITAELSIVEGDLSRTDHAQAFLRLLNAYILDEMGGGAPIVGEKAGRLIAELRRFPSKVILFAKKDDSLVGMSVSFIAYSTFKACLLLNIHDFIVLTGYRGQGVGRKLMEATEARARQLGCGKITLEVRRDNEKARQLYASMGYGECAPPMSFWVKYL